MRTLDCHEQRKIIEPVGVCLAKSLESAPVRRSSGSQKLFGGLFEKGEFELDHRLVIDLIGRTRRRKLDIGRIEDALIGKPLQTNEQRISRAGRETLEWRISISRGIKRQYLPEVHSARLKKVKKAIRGRAKVANAVWAR